ncbi:MAG: protein phosphatase 2C domain-containing protein [Polyangiaceae bacterium]|nr:protein phosphatase 2C domain-containing protein [Polyangiaceae bacterium]
MAAVFQILPRFDYRVDCGVAQSLGPVRETQEDAILSAPEHGLFVVADGMGGHAAGEVASALALEAVRDQLADRRALRVAEAYVTAPDLGARRRVFALLRQVVEGANRAVRERAGADEALRGMGTTLDVVWLLRGHAFLAHAGDGRVYLARASAVLQLTQDHGELDTLRSEGRVSPLGRRRAAGDRLLNAVGLADEITVDTSFVAVGRGDRLLLCTDGVHGPLGDEARLGELLRRGDARAASSALVHAACERGRDNATAVVLEIGERFVSRAEAHPQLASADLESVRASPLFAGMPPAQVWAALSIAVEVELGVEATVPCAVASDLVTYVVLEGIIAAGGRRVAAGALLFPESLVGVWSGGALPRVEEPARLLRFRQDDFLEICDGDPALSAALHRRLAAHLARASGGGRASVPPPPGGAA